MCMREKANYNETEVVITWIKHLFVLLLKLLTLDYDYRDIFCTVWYLFWSDSTYPSFSSWNHLQFVPQFHACVPEWQFHWYKNEKSWVNSCFSADIFTEHASKNTLVRDQVLICLLLRVWGIAGYNSLDK